MASAEKETESLIAVRQHPRGESPPWLTSGVQKKRRYDMMVSQFCTELVAARTMP